MLTKNIKKQGLFNFISKTPQVINFIFHKKKKKEFLNKSEKERNLTLYFVLQV